MGGGRSSVTKRLQVCVVTQNVDGLHQAAGSAPVHELHGSMSRASCLDGCGWVAPIHGFLVHGDGLDEDGRQKRQRLDDTVPTATTSTPTYAHAPLTGYTNSTATDADAHNAIAHNANAHNMPAAAYRATAKLRPPRAVPTGVPRCGGCGACPAKPDCTLFGEPLPEAAMRAARSACVAADAVIVVGTSLSVFPAAELPQLARLHTPGAPLVEINAVHTETPAGADVTITGKAAEVLPLLVKRVLELRKERRAVAAAAAAATGGEAREEHDHGDATTQHQEHKRQREQQQRQQQERREQQRRILAEHQRRPQMFASRRPDDD